MKTSTLLCVAVSLFGCSSALDVAERASADAANVGDASVPDPSTTSDAAPPLAVVDVRGIDPSTGAHFTAATWEAPQGGVRLDVTWPGATRVEGGARDGLWLFLRGRLRGETELRALRLATDPEVHAADASLAAVEPSQDGTGAWVVRATPGESDLVLHGIRLALGEPADTLAKIEEIRVFCVEMVRVPEGDFLAGDGLSPGRFHDGPTPSSPARIGADAVTLGLGAGQLWADATRVALPSGDLGAAPWDGASVPLSPAFPTGARAFWMMKHEITQGLYAEFLDSLPPQQADALMPSAQELAAERYRYTIERGADGHVRASAPSRANNWMRWEDSLAFADWSGLRPMTELEFEKAARGQGPAVAGEYAWGTADILGITGVAGEDGSGAETPLPADANTLYQRTVRGPVRAGLHRGGTTRARRGASYWGILDLSGNVVEMVVTVGNAAGRAFSGAHGDGTLGANGLADVAGWPRAGAGNGTAVVTDGGWGFRGGDFWNPELDLRTSARNVATFAGARRLFGLGFRAVRSAP